MRASTDAELGVDPCQTARHQRHAEGVHDDMMIARVPKESIGRSLEQGEPEQRSSLWVNRPRQISLHPRFRRGGRIVFGADIDDRHGPEGRSAYNLAWLPRLLGDLHTQRFSLEYNLS